MIGLTNAEAVVSGEEGAWGPLVSPGLRWGFALVASLFFLWAVANNFNDVLIRQFQKALGLNRAQAGFIQFVFYIGYFTVALPAGLVMRRLGYKAGILVGLGLYAMGALLFYPASLARTYPSFLAALFLIAAGAATLETAANPYVTLFGDPRRAAQRLNLVQAFNGLGGFLAPVLGGLLIFSGVEHSQTAQAAMSPAALEAWRIKEASTVQLPYLVLGGCALLIACAVALTRLPRLSATSETDAPLAAQFAKIRREPALVRAVVAQFFYVGAQVGVWSFFIDFVKDVAPAIPERQAAFLLSGSLVLFLLGRASGAALMGRIAPAKLLMIYALANVGICGLAATLPGVAAIGCLLLTSFFMSIMFPTIFAMGVGKLGALAPIGSSCIVMAIIGGAVFPPLMGLVATGTGSLRDALLLPIGCFLVVALYARRNIALSL